jgi:hypothetical protein
LETLHHVPTVQETFTLSILLPEPLHMCGLYLRDQLLLQEETPTLTVDFGSTAGNITASAVNSCGEGFAKFFPVSFSCRTASAELMRQVLI